LTIAVVYGINGCFCFNHSPTILANQMVMAAGDNYFSLREPHTAAGTGDCVAKATRNQELQGATNHPQGQGDVLLLHWIQ
jgi:hypothetical protein